MSDDLDEEAELPEWSRTYAGYRERFVAPFVLAMMEPFPRRLELAQAPCVSASHAKESKASADGSCTASTVWDAGIVLATRVFRERAQRAPSTSVLLDLGAGTGVVGLAAAASGGFGRVLLSDLPTVVPLLQRNAAANAAEIPPHATVQVLPLTWDDPDMLRRAAASVRGPHARSHTRGRCRCRARPWVATSRTHACAFVSPSPQGPFHLIVGGDLLYRLPVVQPLLQALRALASAETEVLLAASLQHSPETIRAFAVAAEADGFRVERFASDVERDGQWFSPEVRLLRLTRAIEGRRGRQQGQLAASVHPTPHSASSTDQVAASHDTVSTDDGAKHDGTARAPSAKPLDVMDAPSNADAPPRTALADASGEAAGSTAGGGASDAAVGRSAHSRRRKRRRSAGARSAPRADYLY